MMLICKSYFAKIVKTIELVKLSFRYAIGITETLFGLNVFPYKWKDVKAFDKIKQGKDGLKKSKLL